MGMTDEYEVIKEIAEGGEGKLYLVKYIRTGRLYAMKTSEGGMLKEESDILKQLNDRGFPYLVDYGEEDGKDILIMEYVEGCDLSEYIRMKDGLKPEEALDIFEKVTELVAYLHSRRPAIVHRDIKPQNIMIDEEGAVKIVDLGAAVSGFGSAEVSRGAGTPGYAAPESLRSGTVTASADVYSLGVLLSYMISGTDPVKPPYRPAGGAECLGKLSPFMCEVLDRCLASSVAERYQSAAAVQNAVKDAREREGKQSFISGFVTSVKNVLCMLLTADTMLIVFSAVNCSDPSGILKGVPAMIRDMLYTGHNGKIHMCIAACITALAFILSWIGTRTGERYNFVISRDINLLYTEKTGRGLGV